MRKKKDRVQRNMINEEIKLEYDKNHFGFRIIYISLRNKETNKTLKQ